MPDSVTPAGSVALAAARAKQGALEAVGGVDGPVVDRPDQRSAAVDRLSRRLGVRAVRT